MPVRFRQILLGLQIDVQNPGYLLALNLDLLCLNGLHLRNLLNGSERPLDLQVLSERIVF